MASGQKVRIPIQVTTEGIEKIEKLRAELTKIGNDKFSSTMAGELKILKKAFGDNTEEIVKYMYKWGEFKASLAFPKGSVEMMKEYERTIARLSSYLEKNGFGNLSKFIEESNVRFAETANNLRELENQARQLGTTLEQTLDTTRTQWFKDTGRETILLTEQLGQLDEEALKLDLSLKKDQERFEKLKTEYNKTQKEIDRLNNNTKKSFASLVTYVLKYRVALAAVRAVGNALRNTITGSVSAAASAEQVYSKLRTVFDGLNSSMDKTSELAKAIGVANSTAASALSTVGDLLQAQGMGVAESLETATKWVEQFQDIIAFKDIDMSLEEFASTFMAGAAGNTRNFRQFGSIVKETTVQAELAKKGLDKLTGQELELAKMTTRAEIALRQQANAIGATEREWETTLSINRRLEESTKKLQENTGNWLNNYLNPIKEAWTDIVNDINEAIERKQFFDSLNEGSNAKERDTIFDKDYGFLSAFLETTGGKNSKDNSVSNIVGLTDKGKSVYESNPDFVKYINGLSSRLFAKTTLQEINAGIEYFDASVEDFIAVSNLFSKGITEESIATLKSWEASRLASKKAQDNSDKALQIAESYTNQYDNLFEALGTITGVDLGNKSYLGYVNEEKDKSTNIANSINDKRKFGLFDTSLLSDVNEEAFYVNAFNKGISDILANTLTSLQKADLTKFGNALDIYVKGENEKELLEAKQEEIYKAMEVIWNEAVKTATLDEEGKLVFEKGKQDTLDGLKALYDKTGEDIQAIIDAEEAEKERLKLEEEAEKERLKLEEERIKLIEETRADINNQISEMIANRNNTALEKQARGIGIAINGTVYQAKNNEQAKALVEMKNAIEANIRAMREAEMAEEEITAKTRQLTSEYEEQIKNMRTFSLEDIWGNSAEGKVVGKFLDNTEIGQFVEGIMETYEDTQSPYAAIIDAILQLMSRLEGWDEFVQKGSEFLDLAANIFEPLLPVLNIIADFINNIVKALAPIIHVITKVVAIGMIAIETGISAIIGGIERVIKALKFGFVNLENPMLNAMQKTAQEMGLGTSNNSLKQGVIIMQGIADMDYDIADNVKDIADKNRSELDVYRKLHEKGFLNDLEYQTMLGSLQGLKFDRVNTFSLGSFYNTPEGQTKVYYGDIVININGSNLSAEDVFREAQNKLRAGGNLF